MAGTRRDGMAMEDGGLVYYCFLRGRLLKSISLIVSVNWTCVANANDNYIGFWPFLLVNQTKLETIMFAVIKRRTAPPVILFIFLVQRKTLEVISAVVTILIAIMRRHFTCTKMKIVFYFLQCDQRAIVAHARARKWRQIKDRENQRQRFWWRARDPVRGGQLSAATTKQIEKQWCSFRWSGERWKLMLEYRTELAITKWKFNKKFVWFAMSTWLVVRGIPLANRWKLNWKNSSNKYRCARARSIRFSIVSSFNL